MSTGPSASTPLPPLSGASIAYRDTHLGLWSSHPHWLQAGNRRLRQVLIGVMLLIYGAVFYAWLRGHSPDELLKAVWSWGSGAGGRVAMAVGAFALGMLATASFQTRWAMHKHRDRSLARGGTRGGSGVNLAMVGAVALTGFVLPLVLTFTPGLALELRLLGPLLALLPVMMLSHLLANSDEPPVTFPWLSLLLPTSLWLLAIFGDLQAWLVRHVPTWLALFFPNLVSVDGWRHATIALAVLATLVGVFRLALWVRDRLRGRARSTVVALPPEEPPVAVPDPTAWATEMAKRLGLQPATVKSIKPADEEAVEWQQGSEFGLLFDGKCPTQDQHKVLRNFCHLMEVGPAAAGQADMALGFEMLLEGPSGSGRSTTLDAMALTSVLVYGTRALMFVPDTKRAQLVVARLQQKLQRLHLADFLKVGSIEDAIADVTDRPAPEVLVTTVEAWETRVTGALAGSGAERERLSSLMQTYTTVLVDDFTDYPLPVRLHLPFVVDKHRLLLESAMIPSARVYAFPRLAEAGRQLAVDRLIGHGGLHDAARQLAKLRYRKDLTAMVLEVDATNIGDTIDRIAEELCKSGKTSALMRKGIGAEEASRQTEDFRTRFAGSSLTVCYCHDQLETLIGDVSSIVMKAAEGPDAVFALQSHRPEDGLVMIRIRNSRELPAPAAITPLIVDRSGRGMAEAHLLNILGFIPECTPIPQRAWGQLGTPGRLDGAPATDREIGRLLLDRPEDADEAAHRSRPYLRTLGAFMALDKPFTRYAPVDCQWIAQTGAAWWADGGDKPFGPQALCLPEPTESSADRNTAVLWKGNDGAELGRTQLNYTETLLLQRGQSFCPEVLRIDRAGSIEISATGFRGNGRDAIHPKFEFEWQTQPIDRERGAALPDSGSGGPEHGYLWVDPGDRGAQDISARLIERTDDFDRPTPCFEFEFGYQALVRVMLLVPNKDVIEHHQAFREALAEVFAEPEPWGTGHPTFLPGVTYALTRGIEFDLPSSAFLGRLLAFQAQGAMKQFAEGLVWFVEPQGTGRTLSNAVHELLRSDGFRLTLAERMDAIISQGWDKSPPEEMARFWLPRRLRAAVSLFERRLVANLATRRAGDILPKPKPPSWDEAGPSLPSDALPRPSGWRYACTACGTGFTHESDVPSGMRFFSCCERTVAMLVATEGDTYSTPRALLTPWWPAEVRKPAGSAAEITMAVWEMVAQRIEYLFDHQQREGLEEFWMTPAETWERGCGDCEDHSILIVTMLRTLGVKCWLTWGDAGGEGHAWVEAEIDGTQVLIEATSKSPLPRSLPTVDSASDVYGQVYDPEKHRPGRTDGQVYAEWLGDGWREMEIFEPVPVRLGELAEAGA